MQASTRADETKRDDAQVHDDGTESPVVAAKKGKVATKTKPAPQPASRPEPVKRSAKQQPRDPFAGIADDIDDLDWLLPAVPDAPPPPEPEPEPEPQPKVKPDPRQLSLF